MTKKETKSKEEKIEEVMETPVEEIKATKIGEQPLDKVEETENGEQPETEVESLQKQLDETESKIAENLDGWQRSQAEFINYKNRVQRDRELDFVTMKGDIIKKMLPVLDDLQLALANHPESDTWAEGMDLIARKFQNVLESEGVTRIEAAGQPFDPNFHEAISSEPNDDVESGHVIEVTQNGYLLGERVIRPAMVRVAE